MQKKLAEKKSNNIGHRARLRERFLKGGADSIADYELIELLLSLCIPRIDVKPIAKEMLLKHISINGILNAKDEELLSIKGFGESALCAMKILRACIARHHQESLSETDESLDTVAKLTKFFKARIATEKNEILEMVCFDSQLHILQCGAIRLLEGNVNSANVEIRKIAEIALRYGASSIALAHNHPSGNCKPSPEDIRFTKELSSVCRVLKVDFIEHIIVSKTSSFSFRKNGHLDKLYDSTLPYGTRGNMIGIDKKSLA